MLFKGKSGTDSCLFKDNKTINYRNTKDYLANIHILAEGIRKSTSIHSSDNLLTDPSLIKNGPHTSVHNGCAGFGIKDDVTKVDEKRICKCMYYYNENNSNCLNCKLKKKWKNVGDIQIIECEFPTKEVIKSVGGIDLILKDTDGKKYAAEVKPYYSPETLVRMIAEAYTIFSYDQKFKPAICFFKNSKQHIDFCNPIFSNENDFQYLLTKINVFYITIENTVGDVNEFVIHNNANETVPMPSIN
jgi:hypothetical protein